MNNKPFPNWAIALKQKGQTLRWQGDKIQLFKVSSKRIKGKTYPVIKQEYIGLLTEKGIAYKKEDKNKIQIIEYGLTYFLFKHYKRELSRSSYGYAGDLKNEFIVYSILKFAFKEVDSFVIDSTFLGQKYKDIIDLDFLKSKTVKINNLTRKIDELLTIEFKEKKEFIVYHLLLLSCPLVSKLNDTHLNKIYSITGVKL